MSDYLEIFERRIEEALREVRVQFEPGTSITGFLAPRLAAAVHAAVVKAYNAGVVKGNRQGASVEVEDQAWMDAAVEALHGTQP